MTGAQIETIIRLLLNIDLLLCAGLGLAVYAIIGARERRDQITDCIEAKAPEKGAQEP